MGSHGRPCGWYSWRLVCNLLAHSLFSEDPFHPRNYPEHGDSRRILHSVGCICGNYFDQGALCRNIFFVLFCFVFLRQGFSVALVSFLELALVEQGGLELTKIHLPKLGGGGASLWSQHLGGRDRRIFVSLRTAWSTRASSRTASKATEKPCLKKTKQNKTSPI